MRNEVFRVGLSADFLDENRQLIFPELGMCLTQVITTAAAHPGGAGPHKRLLKPSAPQHMGAALKPAATCRTLST